MSLLTFDPPVAYLSADSESWVARLRKPGGLPHCPVFGTVWRMGRRWRWNIDGGFSNPADSFDAACAALEREAEASVARRVEHALQQLL